jgi:DNA mismatch endonuclease (patch repair protein)
MSDSLSPKERSKRMALIRAKNTGLELFVRRLIYSLGYRYRLHGRELPGKPDIVFASRRKVILVHGCFWHWHTSHTCKIAHLPKSRREYWMPKLQRNRDRDKAVQQDLLRLGWQSLIVWECQVSNLDLLRMEIVSFLGPTTGKANAT